MTAALRTSPSLTTYTTIASTVYAGLVRNEFQALWAGAPEWLSSVSGTDTIVANVDTSVVAAPTSVGSGKVFGFTAPNTNTTAVTINIASIGAVSLKRRDGSALQAGDLAASSTYQAMKVGSAYRLLGNPENMFGRTLTLNSASAAIEIGTTGSVCTPYIDFHTGAGASDYDVRLLASGGSATDGAGKLNLVGRWDQSAGATGGANSAASARVQPTGTFSSNEFALYWFQGGTISGVNGASGTSRDAMTATAVNGLFSVLQADCIVGSSASGGRIAVFGRTLVDGDSGAATSKLQEWVGTTGQTIGRANVGGVSLVGSNAKGLVWGMNAYASLQTGATFWAGAVGIEIDMDVQTGSSLRNKIGLTIIQTANDAIAGGTIDAAIAVANASVSNPGWLTAIDIGADGYWPMKSSGTIFLTRAGTTTYGIDFNATTFTTGAIRSPNFLVDGSGNITGRQMILGIPGSVTAAMSLYGATSGAVTVQVQAAAGTFNWNLPQSAGSAFSLLLSGGGSTSPMTWLAVGGTGRILTGVTASSPVWSAQPVIGLNGTIAGILGIAGSTSGQVNIQPGAAAAGTYNFNLPITVGAAGTVLTSQNGGSTAMTWTTLATVATSGSAADLTGRLAYANLTQGSALSVLGVAGNATADVASIAAASDNQVLRRSGTALAFGATNLASSAAVTGLLPFANIADGSALSVFGRSANSTGVHADIAGTANQVLVVNGAGTTLAFGSIDLAQSAAVGSSILPKANGGFGQSMAAASGLDQWNAGTLSFFDPTTKRIPFGAGSHGLEDASDFTWDKTNKILAVGATTALDSANLIQLEVGNGTGKRYIRINGGTGADTGAGILFDQAGTSTFGTGRIGFLGNYAAYVGGTDANMALVAANNFKIYPGGTLIATFTSAAVGINTSTLDGRFNVSGVSGTSSTATFLSGASGQFLTVNFGRASREWTLGTAGASDQFFTGTVAGSSVIAYGTKLFIGSGSVDASGTLGMTISATQIDLSLDLYRAGTKVLGARSTGWTNQTASASKADLGASPTVGALASWASAIDAMLKAHGITGT